MFLLVAIAVLLGSFAVLFGLWLLIWTFTMSSSAELNTVLVEEYTVEAP